MGNASQTIFPNSGNPGLPLTRQSAIVFRTGLIRLVAVCEEIVYRAAPGNGSRVEYANGRGTLAGVGLKDAAEVVGMATGNPVELTIDRMPITSKFFPYGAGIAKPGNN